MANSTDDGWPESLGDWWKDGIEDDQKQKYALCCLTSIVITFLKKKTMFVPLLDHSERFYGNQCGVGLY